MQHLYLYSVQYIETVLWFLHNSLITEKFYRRKEKKQNPFFFFFFNSVSCIMIFLLCFSVKYTVATVTTTCRNVTPAQTRLQFSRYEQEENSERFSYSLVARFGIGDEGIYHTSSAWFEGSGAGPCWGQFMLWVYYPALLWTGETTSLYLSFRVRQRRTYRQTVPLTRAGGQTLVVVVVETISYDLLQVHIGEVSGLQSIQDSKIMLTGRVNIFTKCLSKQPSQSAQSMTTHSVPAFIWQAASRPYCHGA